MSKPAYQHGCTRRLLGVDEWLQPARSGHFAWKTSDTGPNEHAAFDSWVADEASLAAYITRAGWDVDWDDKAENARDDPGVEGFFTLS